ncbi:Lovastatin diketide synthase LovF [Cytospora mali]|uniref:Lovastatin diketide synthase LovF n=1 Tax=Cytospora mali TaxID=578113 RepID=A0A194V2H3_CYTMA|nr:Lovastatin diketide synthase LovF [Valsa mali var. pyri (nom. inval.)]
MVVNHSGSENYADLTAPTETMPGVQPRARPPYRQEPIAVVGMACRLPGESNTPKALWDFLMRGGIADCTQVPKSRFNRSTHYDGSTKPKTMRSPGGLFLENIDVPDFDAAFFATSHVDATTMDPQQHYDYMQARDPDDRPPSVTIGGAMKGAASLSGKCHTFDVKADGYIKAEGVNAVYLKRLSDAVRDGDPIRAVIRGTSTNIDGRTPGIASPSAEAQALAIRAAYANAGISDFNDTSSLEFHGTGTQVGDPTEVTGAASVFAPSRDPKKPLYIGSVKSNIGHSEPAAGISGLLKAILSIENGMIPGNPTFIHPNPKIDFVGSKVSVSRLARPWPKAPFKRASVNSFGYGGSNAHVVLEGAGSFVKTLCHLSSVVPDTYDFFDMEEQPAPSRPYIFVLSANDDESLQANFSRLSSHLLNPKVKAELSDLAYTLSERRSRLFSRGYIVTSSTRLDAAKFVRGKRSTDPPKIGFVFTGQGAQWSQMGHDLMRTFPSAKPLLQSLDDSLQGLPDPQKWRLLAEFLAYTEGLEDLVTIACFNSPQSISLSGPVTALEQVRARLSADKKFVRMLQVNLAYHSKFMDAIGEDYLTLLSPQLTGKKAGKDMSMFSSVAGKKMESSADAEYWRSNMVNAVHFDGAVTEMLTGDDSPDFLIEVGPSGALSGPINQIKAAIGDDVTHVQYAAALSRGRDAILSIYDLAGKLFVAGSPIDLAAVNQLGRNGEKKPSVLIDLPNYGWNHSTKYWYENDASKDWRYRLFPHHDFLGSKVLGASWNEPSFRKKLLLEDLPWLKDHKMGTDIIFPASGFISMAVEAIRQKSKAPTILEGKPENKSSAYRVRNMTFSRALVLEEKKEQKFMLTLVPKTGNGNTWHSYKVSSLVGDVWQENSRGLIKIEEGEEERLLSSDILGPLKFPIDGSLWYKAMNDVDYGFGPAFQKQIQIECVSNKRISRSIVSLQEPESAYQQSP